MRSLRQAVAVLAICGSFVSVVAFNAASEESWRSIWEADCSRPPRMRASCWRV
jgi:hypothetical protein